MIKIRELYFEYPGSDFKFSISKLDIKGGAKVAVIGPSGYGKTTFLNLLSGISTPVKGEIEVDSEDIGSLSDSERRSFRISKIGFVFQNFELVEYLTILDNILLPYRINPSLTLTGEVRSRARALSEKMGLSDKLKRNVTKLSQGEMQRVAICRALLTEPRLLLADEPTGNLDPTNKELTIQTLFDYAERRESTLVMVTHDHSLLSGFDSVIDLESYGN
ncbi:MAG: ABC transporter ATP-binding protein [Candidatus Dadabacteria bacterium]|nr:MAG: ABC transporter ATP-binding protein [Candidatus Dadabacteria bacterium]